MNLETSYLGITLRNPLIAAAGPFAGSAEGVAELVAAGAGAAVMPSLFAEEIADVRGAQTERYLAQLRHTADAGIPIIASLNGTQTGPWVEQAARLADAGAVAIELNLYGLPGDTGLSSVGVEDQHLEILEAVSSRAGVPVAVKLSPYMTGVGGLVTRLEAAGAAGVVLFNRVVVPDVDLGQMTLVPGAALSRREDGAVPRAWIAALRREVDLALAGSGGVEEAEDVVKYLLVGADVVMVASALVRHGVDHVRTLVTGVEQWLAAHGYDDVAQVRGSLARRSGTDPEEQARTDYVAALSAANALPGDGQWRDARGW